MNIETSNKDNPTHNVVQTVLTIVLIFTFIEQLHQADPLKHRLTVSLFLW